MSSACLNRSPIAYVAINAIGTERAGVFTMLAVIVLGILLIVVIMYKTEWDDG